MPWRSRSMPGLMAWQESQWSKITTVKKLWRNMVNGTDTRKNGTNYLTRDWCHLHHLSTHWQDHWNNQNFLLQNLKTVFPSTCKWFIQRAIVTPLGNSLNLQIKHLLHCHSLQFPVSSLKEQQCFWLKKSIIFGYTELPFWPNNV